MSIPPSLCKIRPIPYQRIHSRKKVQPRSAKNRLNRRPGEHNALLFILHITQKNIDFNSIAVLSTPRTRLPFHRNMIRMREIGIARKVSSLLPVSIFYSSNRSYANPLGLTTISAPMNRQQAGNYKQTAENSFPVHDFTQTDTADNHADNRNNIMKDNCFKWTCLLHAFVPKQKRNNSA